MRRLIGLLLVFLCSCHAIAQSAANKQSPFPLQLEMRVPFEPTAFPSGGRSFLMYELHLTNFGPSSLSLMRVEVFDADQASMRPLATLDPEQLKTMWQIVGGASSSPADAHEDLSLAAGQRALVFLSVSFDRASQIPARIAHRIVTADSALDGAIISTHHNVLLTLGPPVEGANWAAEDGPSNDPDNRHRRGVIIFDGRAVDSRRYAIDWKQVRDGAAFSGDPRDVDSYYCHGKEVLAVANGRVVASRNGLPENVPGHGDAFHPAVPITLDTVGGNTISLDLGNGQFAHYLHLQPGSIRVKTGEHVRRGQVLARIGASGDAREPHLHFEVTDSPALLAGEGLPYVIDRYRLTTANSRVQALRTHELPLNHSVVTFGDDRGK